MDHHTLNKSGCLYNLEKKKGPPQNNHNIMGALGAQKKFKML